MGLCSEICHGTYRRVHRPNGSMKLLSVPLSHVKHNRILHLVRNAFQRNKTIPALLAFVFLRNDSYYGGTIRV